MARLALAVRERESVEDARDNLGEEEADEEEEDR